MKWSTARAVCGRIGGRCWRPLPSSATAAWRSGPAGSIRRSKEKAAPACRRGVPGACRPLAVRQLRPFFDIWQDALQRLAPAGSGNPGVALLTPSGSEADWFEHMLLARELSCALVEGGDLTIRAGRLYLKTLR